METAKPKNSSQAYRMALMCGMTSKEAVAAFGYGVSCLSMVRKRQGLPSLVKAFKKNRTDFFSHMTMNQLLAYKDVLNSHPYNERMKHEYDLLTKEINSRKKK